MRPNQFCASSSRPLHLAPRKFCRLDPRGDGKAAEVALLNTLPADGRGGFLKRVHIN